MLLWYATCCIMFSIQQIHGHSSINSAPFHPNIHILGNTGTGGIIHAWSARYVTRLIDKYAYNGRNMRREVATHLATVYDKKQPSILEIGCGVGTLTEELVNSGFCDITAVDTSLEMLNVAKKNVPGAMYKQMNGIDVSKNFDVIIACMVCHELPKIANQQLVDAMCERVYEKKGDVWIFDIHTLFKPSYSMLTGEPFLPQYLETFDNLIKQKGSESVFHSKTFPIIPQHVQAWVLEHKNKPSII